MLRKELFGGNSTHDQSDRLNKILSGTEITGDIVSDANLLIEGEIIGNISCSGKVIIGTSGKIRGNLVCVNAEVDGAMDGELTIENLLVLHSTARPASGTSIDLYLSTNIIFGFLVVRLQTLVEQSCMCL